MVAFANEPAPPKPATKSKTDPATTGQGVNNGKA